MPSPEGSSSQTPSPPTLSSSRLSTGSPSAPPRALRPAFRRSSTAPDRVVSTTLTPISSMSPPSHDGQTPPDAARMLTNSSNAAGTKTPKKVSWATGTSGDTPHVHHNGVNFIKAKDIRELHHLDERGLDPNVFQSLKHALEQHQSTSGGVLTQDQSSPEALSLSGLSTANATIGTDLLHAIDTAPSSGEPSSFLPSPRSETTESFLPPDLTERSARTFGGEAIIEPTETHGLPAPVPSDFEQTRAGDVDPAAAALLIREGEGGRDVNWRRSERKASRLVRAHTRGFKVISGFRGSHDIHPDDRAKLRDSFATVRMGSGRHSVNGEVEGSEEKGKETKEDHHQSRFSRFWKRRSRKDSAATTGSTRQDVEKSAHRPSGPLNPPLNPPLRTNLRSELIGDPGGGVHVGGTGVLSALLALYDRRGGAATPSSSMSLSGRSSPVDSEWDDDEEADQREAKRNAARNWAFVRRSGESRRESGRERERRHERAPSQVSDLAARDEAEGDNTAPLEPPHPLYAQEGSFGGADGPTQERRHSADSSILEHEAQGHVKGLKGSLSALGASLSSSHLPLSNAFADGLGLGDARPAQARSGGGVFGPLIASAATLAGAAAPEPARVAPDTTRPGYHLSRYSWSGEEPLPGARPSITVSPTVEDGGGNGKRASLALSSADRTSPSGSQESNEGEVTPPLSFTPRNLRVKIPGDRERRAATGVGAAQEKSAASSSSTTHTDSATVIGAAPSFVSGTTAAGLGNGSGSGGKVGAAASKVKGWAALLPRSYSAGSFGGWISDTKSLKGSTPGTPGSPSTPDSMSESGVYWDEKKRKWVRADKAERKRRKRKKAEIYITRHVAEILQRQEFVLKLTRAFMMFGAPSHRLPAQLHATARVLDMELSCMYLPDVMLISFDDSSTGTSSIKFIRQGSALDLGKLQDAYELYWKVIHDDISVSDASRSLDVLMQQKPVYAWWQIVPIGGFCSSAICSVAFSGSFIDSLVAFPLGALLVAVQLLSVRNELYSNVFEITIATLLSFVSAVLAGTHRFCYSAVASASVVLILPGFIVLNGSLELSSRNITSGAVRLCYAVMYSLFLGFGLSIGGTVYEKVLDKQILGPEDYSCATTHKTDGPWYQRTPSMYWGFLTVPMYSLFLSLRNHFPYRRKELFVNVLVACMGWTCNYFSSLKFPERKDVSSAIGAFSVGVVANIYGRFFSGNAFVIMITGILFQLPSGLGNGGLLTFAQRNNESGSTTSYISGFQTALQLVSVSIGLTVGLGLSLVIVFPIQSRKRQAGVFSL